MRYLMSCRALAVVLGLAIGAGVATAPARAADTAAQSASGTGLVHSIRTIRRSVVGITTVQYGRPLAAQLSGTGFVVGDGRHVLTNSHVIKSTPQTKQNLFVMAMGANGPDRRAATVVASDPGRDLALLRIDGKPLPPARLARASDIADEGESIAITGFPIGTAFGLVPASNAGIISAVTPAIGAMPHSSMLTAEMLSRPSVFLYQLDMVAFPGNSGSPLYRADTGDVIGIVVAGIMKKEREQALANPTSITYALPVSYIHDLIARAGVTP